MSNTMNITTMNITVRAFSAAERALAAELAGNRKRMAKNANAAGRRFRAAGIDLDAVAVLLPRLVGPGMGDAWAHMVDAWHGR